MDIGKMDADKIKSVSKDLWEGNVPLVKTFWVYYVVALVVLNIIKGTVMILGFLPDVWSIIMVVPIWRAAGKYEGYVVYGVLARVFAVLSALGAAAGLYYYMGWLLR